MTTLGARLKKCRTMSGLSQNVLAIALNKKGRATISSWENNKSDPSLSDLRKVAEILKTTVSYLMGEMPMFEEPRENYTIIKKDDLIELQRKALEREEEKNKSLVEELGKSKTPEE
jgi:transcriptional regulator with XRE-family HTH domain